MNKTWRNIIISTLLAIAVYLFVFYSETTVFPKFIEQWVGILLAVVLVNLIGWGMISLNVVLNKYVPWNSKITLRFVIEVCTGILLSAIAAVLFVYVFIAQTHTNDEITLVEFIYDGAIKFGILSVVIIYVYSLINFSIFSYNQYSVGQIEAITSDRIQLDLRFAALKSQLNPHFLFNALNTISSLIYMDVKLAEDYIRQLARTYDYILATDDTKLIAFQEELEMVRGYFFMQKTRYDDRVHLNVSKELENITGYIPPFTLQILVENALKHSTISEENPLKIEIFSNNNNIVVRNNIVDKHESTSSMNYLLNKQKESESYKIGLSNIRARYKFLTNKIIEVSSDTDFTVSIPLIQEDEIKNSLSIESYMNTRMYKENKNS